MVDIVHLFKQKTPVQTIDRASLTFTFIIGVYDLEFETQVTETIEINPLNLNINQCQMGTDLKKIGYGHHVDAVSLVSVMNIAFCDQESFDLFAVLFYDKINEQSQVYRNAHIYE